MGSYKYGFILLSACNFLVILLASALIVKTYIERKRQMGDEVIGQVNAAFSQNSSDFETVMNNVNKSCTLSLSDNIL